MNGLAILQKSSVLQAAVAIEQTLYCIAFDRIATSTQESVEKRIKTHSRPDRVLFENVGLGEMASEGSLLETEDVWLFDGSKTK